MKFPLCVFFLNSVIETHFNFLRYSEHMSPENALVWSDAFSAAVYHEPQSTLLDGEHQRLNQFKQTIEL